MSVSDEPSAVGWRFFLWWMLAFLGFPLGGLLALVPVGSVDGVASGAVAGASAGTGIGDLLIRCLATGVAVRLSQWALLRRRVQAANLWGSVVAAAWPIGSTSALWSSRRSRGQRCG